MNNTNNSAIFVGLLAGLAAAALLYSAGRGTSLSMLLLFVVPLPIYLASFAYGTYAAIASAIGMTVLVGFAGVWETALVNGLLLALPAALVGHQANLAQMGEDEKTIYWYPLEKLFTNLLLVLAAGFILVGMIIQYDVESIVASNFEHFQAAFKTMPNAVPMSDDDMRKMLSFVLNVFPFMVPAMWVLIHVLNAVAAEKITQASGRMARPKTDFALQASLPSMLVLPALGSVALMFLLSGPLLHILAVVAGVMLAGFSLIGLAGSHLKARTSKAGNLMLFVIYFLIISFSLIPIFFYSGLGMMRMWTANPPIKPSS